MTQHSSMTTSRSDFTPDTSVSVSRRSAVLCLLLIAPVPSVGVWFAAYGATGALGSFMWALAKVWLIIGPLVCWWYIQKQPKSLPRLASKGLWLGLISGVLSMAVIILAYALLARNRVDFSAMQMLLAEAGITHVWHYLAIAAYLTLFNSLVEEYVFRWFMFTQLRQLMPSVLAVLVSALIFTAHHSLILSAYVTWEYNALASLGVFSGGLMWSYLYYRYGRIWPAYISHIGADIGVFLIGYDALF